MGLVVQEDREICAEMMLSASPLKLAWKTYAQMANITPNAKPILIALAMELTVTMRPAAMEELGIYVAWMATARASKPVWKIRVETAITRRNAPLILTARVQEGTAIMAHVEMEELGTCAVKIPNAISPKPALETCAQMANISPNAVPILIALAMELTVTMRLAAMEELGIYVARMANARASKPVWKIRVETAITRRNAPLILTARVQEVTAIMAHVEMEELGIFVQKMVNAKATEYVVLTRHAKKSELHMGRFAELQF